MTINFKSITKNFVSSKFLFFQKTDKCLKSDNQCYNRRGRKPALGRPMLISTVAKEDTVNGDNHDGSAVKVDRITERGRTAATSVIGKCNDQRETSLITTTTSATTNATTAIATSIANITDESELFLPKVYDDITQSTPSIAAMNKSDGKFHF